MLREAPLNDDEAGVDSDSKAADEGGNPESPLVLVGALVNGYCSARADGGEGATLADEESSVSCREKRRL